MVQRNNLWVRWLGTSKHLSQEESVHTQKTHTFVFGCGTITTASSIHRVHTQGYDNTSKTTHKNGNTKQKPPKNGQQTKRPQLFPCKNLIHHIIARTLAVSKHIPAPYTLRQDETHAQKIRTTPSKRPLRTNHSHAHFIGALRNGLIWLWWREQQQ